MAGLKFGDVVQKAEAAGFGEFKDIEPGTYHIEWTKAEGVERKGWLICSLRFTVVDVIDGPPNLRGQNFGLSVFLPSERNGKPVTDGQLQAFMITLAGLGVDPNELKKMPYDTEDPRAPAAIIALMDLTGLYTISFIRNGKYVNFRNIRKIGEATTAAPSTNGSGGFRAARGAPAPSEDAAHEVPSDPEDDGDASSEEPEPVPAEAPEHKDPDVEAQVTTARRGRRREV